MTIEERNFNIMSGSAVLTALVPADRINTPGDWQGQARPYIIHFPVSLEPTHTFGGRRALNNWYFYQVSIFADSYTSARSVADAIITLLNGTIGTVRFFLRGFGPVTFEPDTRVVHLPLHFQIFEGLSAD